MERNISSSSSYEQRLKSETKDSSVWEIFSYDTQGNLVLNPVEGFDRKPLRISELLHKVAGSEAVQITDLAMIKRRARQLKEYWIGAARTAGYPEEKVLCLKASKSNTKGLNFLTALSELGAEISGEFDLFNIQRMVNGKYIPKDIPVIANGFKNGWKSGKDMGYAQRIIKAHREGINVIPVFGPGGEFEFFNKNLTRRMEVGIRGKFGPVQSETELLKLTSRFGYNLPEVFSEASKIDGSRNMELTMLHMMITAAQTSEPNAFLKSARYAAEIYAQLKKLHPTLKYLNFGGGFPPMGAGFDHQSFLKQYFKEVKDVCKKHNIEEPTIVVESGSFVDKDSEHLLFPVVSVYKNSTKPHYEMNLGQSIMNILDLWVQEDSFPIFAIDKAHNQPIPVRFGDATCDSNCSIPDKDHPDDYVWMPGGTTGAAVLRTGAYQDVLDSIDEISEARTVDHCGQKKPRQLYIFEDGRIWINESPTMLEMSNVAGYSDDMLGMVK